MFEDLRKKQKMDALIARIEKLEKKFDIFLKEEKSKSKTAKDSAIENKKN